jgi:hypothetical protein
MAKLRKGLKGLAGLGNMRSPDRFVVVNLGPYGSRPSCTRRVYTSYGDAAKATLKCSRNRAKEPCILLQGYAGSEKVVGRCVDRKCGRPDPGDQNKVSRCRLDKKKAKGDRRALIARLHADRARGMGPSKASKTGVFPREKLPAELRGRKRR